MSVKKLGGDPKLDRIASIQRFNEMVEPILSKKGFFKIKSNGHTMINENTNTIMICKSCPSDVKHVREIKELVRELKKKHKGYVIYLLFHRNKREWIQKPVYLSVLHSILKNKNLSGIICGLDELSTSFDSIVNGEVIYKI